jgi:hypothetical protein
MGRGQNMDKASALMLGMVALAALGGVALGWALRAIADRQQRREHRRLLTAIVQQGLRAVASRSSAPPELDTGVTTFIRPIERRRDDNDRRGGPAVERGLSAQGKAWHAFVHGVDGDVETKERAETALFSHDALKQMLEEPEQTRGAAGSAASPSGQARGQAS